MKPSPQSVSINSIPSKPKEDSHLAVTHPFKYSFTTCFKERVIRQLLHPEVGHRVLEMGCGSAYFATVLADEFPNTDFEYTGLDMAEESLKWARSYVNDKGKLIQGSVTAMPFASESFDDILYLDVIEHVSDDKKSLGEAFRVLKEGGRLIISTPNSDAPLTDTAFEEYLHDHGHMANQTPGYTKKKLSELLTGAGFVIEKIDYSNVFLSELLIMVTKLGYRMLKPKYESQADMLEVSGSPLFTLHKKIVYPLGYALGRAEEIFLKKAMHGHCLIMLARKP